MADTSIIDIIIKASNKTGRALREPITDLEDLQGALKGASALWAAAGTAAVAAAGVLAKGALDAGDRALEMSEKFGITTEAFSTLEFAARQSNLTNEQFATGMQKLSLSASNAALGNKEAMTAFKALGVSVTDAHGRLLPMDQVLLKVADSFARTPNGAGKAKVAVELFGKAGADLIPMLNQGAEGIGQLQARARELGLEISGPMAQGSDQFKDNLVQLKSASEGAANQILTQLLPGMNSLLQGFLDGQGLGTAFNFILNTLGTALVGVLKIVMSMVVEIDRELEKLGSHLARVFSSAAALAEGGWDQARAAWKAGSEDLARIDQVAAERHAAIWSGVQSGPAKADPRAHREAIEEVLKANDEAKTYLDTQRFLELESIKKMDRAALDSHIRLLEAKRMLNQQEAESYKAYKSARTALDEKEIRSTEDAERRRKETIEKSWNALISMSQSKNAVLMIIGKTAAIAKATMDTYVAANSALAAVPYPYNVFAAGSMVVAGLANVAQIAGVQGFAEGGVVGGTSFTGDNVVIRANSGEEVMTTEDRRSTTAALIGALAELRGSRGGNGKATMVMDKRVLGQIIYDASADGSLFIHPRAVVAR